MTTPPDQTPSEGLPGDQTGAPEPRASDSGALLPSAGSTAADHRAATEPDYSWDRAEAPATAELPVHETAPMPAWGSPTSASDASTVPAAAEAPSAAPAADGAAPAPAAPSVDMAALGARATAPGFSNPLPGLVVAAATWVAGLVSAVVVMVLLTIAFAGEAAKEVVSNATDGATDSLSGMGTLFALPFQLLALGGLGSLGMRADIPMLGDISVSVRFIPLLVTLALILIPFVGARLVVRRRGPSRLLGIIAESLLVGLVVAVLVTLGALIIAVSAPLDEGLTLRMHAAGADSFFGTWFIVGASYAAGLLFASRAAVHGGRFTDLAGAVRPVLLHALAYSVIAFLIVWIVGTVKTIADGGSLTTALLTVPMLSPVMMGQVIAALCGLGMLGSVGVSGGLGSYDMGGSGMGMTEYQSIFSTPWYVWLIALVLGLALLLAAAMLWGAGRTIIPGDIVATVVSWAALPLAYLAGAIVLMVIGYVGGSASAVGQGAVTGWAGLAP